MSSRTLTPDQIRRRGLKALTRSLGPAGTVRFLRQFQTGQGDYTAKRREIIGNPSLDELLQELRTVRRRGKGRQAS